MAQSTPNQAPAQKAPRADFKLLKTKLTVLNLLSHHGLSANFTQDEKGEWSGPCPFHCHDLRRGGFSISADGSKWNSFDKECNCVDGLVNGYTNKPTRGGDLITFVMVRERYKLNSAKGMADAGKFLQDLLEASKTKPTPAPNVTKEEERPIANLTFAERGVSLPKLEPHHIALQDFDLDPDYLETIGAGVQVKGIMAKRLLFPIDNLNGERVAYGGMTLVQGEEPKWQYPKDFDPSLELHGYAQVVDWLKETTEHAPVVFITFNLLTQAIVAQTDYAVAMLSSEASFVQKDALVKMAGARENVHFELLLTPDDKLRLNEEKLRDLAFLLSSYAHVRTEFAAE